MNRTLWRVIEKDTGIILDCGFSDNHTRAHLDALAACLKEFDMWAKQAIAIEIID